MDWQVLMKWGEYSSDVHFILQRTALDTTARNSMQQQQQQNNKSATSRPTKTSVDPLHGFTPPLTSPPPSSNVGAVASIVTASPSKDLKKSLTFSGGGRAGSPNEQRSRHPLNVGVVRGVPKRLENGDDHQQQTHGPQPNGRLDWPSDKSPQVPAPPPPPPPPLLSHYQDNPSSNEEQLVYPRYDPPYGRVRLPLGSNGSSGGGEIPTGLHYSNPSPGAALSNQQDSFQSDLVRFPPPYRNPPPPSSGTCQRDMTSELGRATFLPFLLCDCSCIHWCKWRKKRTRKKEGEGNIIVIIKILKAKKQKKGEKRNWKELKGIGKRG